MQKKSRFNLDKVISVNLRVTLVWFVGLSLMMVNLLTSSNDIIILTVLLVLAFGLILFFVPQFLFHKSIIISKDKLLAGFESDFSSKTTIPLSSDCDPRKSLLLCMLYERTEKISEWPLNTEPILQLVFFAIIPVVTTIVGIAIR